MREFEVFGKKVPIDEKDISAYEDFTGETFDNVTAKYLVNAMEGTEAMNEQELSALIKKSIKEEFKVWSEVSEKMDEGAFDRLPEEQ